MKKKFPLLDSKQLTRLTAALGLFAVLSLSIYFRSYPVSFPQFRQSAEKIAAQQSSMQIAQDINQRYSGLNDLAKAKLFDAALAVYKKNNQPEIKKQISAEYARLKDRFQDKFGQTYLMELDCWHWARHVANIGRFGGIGNEVRNGRQFDSFVLFPQGSYLGSPFFFYFSWNLYKIFSFFYPLALMNFLFYLPLFFMVLFMVLLYFFCYRNWGNVVALVCCIFAGCAPIFIPRSCAGWFDMDILSMIFPILIIWTYLLAYNVSSWKKSIFWVVFSVVWLWLFSATWVGWAFIFFIIALYEILSIINFISERLQYGRNTSAEIKKHLIVFLVFLASVALLIGFGFLSSLVNQIKSAWFLNKPVASTIWPNTLSTVGELKNGDYLSIAKAVGGVFPLFLILLAMLGIFLNIKKYSGMKRELLIILVVWFLSVFFLCSRGIRFAMFLLAPLGIFLGWGIEETYQFFIKKKWKLALIPFGLLVVLLTFEFISSADSNAKSALPLMDDDWYSALTTIKRFTPADSVINSWWDFGDWFKAVSNRRVIFDGQSQNTPQAYWMARVLLTDSEKEALGILRMLNNGGNQAFEIIDKYVRNPFLSISLLKRALMLEPEQGKALLAKYLPAAAVKEVGGILYARPKQKAYFVVDYSMIGKMNPISYLGNWDYLKVYLKLAIRAKSKENVLKDLASFGLEQSLAERYYQEALLIDNRDFDSWVSRRLAVSEIVYQKKQDDDLALFNNGFIYNINKKALYYYSSGEGKYKVPKSIFFMEGDNIAENVYSPSDSNTSALLLEKDDVYKLVMLSPELAKSMFARLQFLNGRGLKHFVLFTREGSDENQILVFEIKWD